MKRIYLRGKAFIQLVYYGDDGFKLTRYIKERYNYVKLK